MEQQSARTRQHAEVFTPPWMCRMMNDYADEVWFGAKEVFFKDGTPTAAVEFPKGKRGSAMWIPGGWSHLRRSALSGQPI